MADVVRTTLLGEVVLIDGKGENVYIYIAMKHL